jgi:hypothetical protein
MNGDLAIRWVCAKQHLQGLLGLLESFIDDRLDCVTHPTLIRPGQNGCAETKIHVRLWQGLARGQGSVFGLS